MWKWQCHMKKWVNNANEIWWYCIMIYEEDEEIY